MKLKKLFSDFGIYGIAPFIPKIAGFFVLPLITPFLTREDFGVYGIITAYSGFFQIFFTLGLQVNLSNSFFKSREQYQWLWRQIYAFWILWSFVYGLLMVGVLWFVIPEAAIEDRVTIIILNVAPIIFFGPTAQMATYYYQFKKKALQVGLRSAIFGVLQVFLILYTIRYLKMGYMGWFWASFITGVLLNISWWIPFNLQEKMTPIFNFKWRTLKRALKVGLPIVPHQNGQYLLNKSDRIVMDLINVSTAQIGLYNVAYKATNAFETIGGAYTKTMTPYVQDLINRKKEHTLRNLFFFSQILFFIAVLMFACIAKEFFQLLIRNDELNGVYQLAVLIVMSVSFRPMYMACNSRLFYFEKTKTLGLYSFAAGILNVGLNIAFIPVWGIEVAAMSTFIGYMFLAYSRFWSKDYRDHAVLEYYPMRWLAASIGVCIAGYFLADANGILRITILTVLIIGGVITLLRFRKALN
jgi:O-antigen/teichoic acid export membrane protein